MEGKCKCQIITRSLPRGLSCRCHCPRCSFHVDALNLVHALQQAKLLIEGLGVRPGVAWPSKADKIQSYSCPFSTHFRPEGLELPHRGIIADSWEEFQPQHEMSRLWGVLQSWVVFQLKHFGEESPYPSCRPGHQPVIWTNQTAEITHNWASFKNHEMFASVEINWIFLQVSNKKAPGIKIS